jgi:hypothetical protein
VTFDKALLEKFGERIPAAERLAMTRKLIAAMEPVFDVRNDAKTKAEAGPPGQSDSEGSFVALTFVAKLPGKVVSTNGEIDEVNGEVFWALYDMAAAAEDVVLTATYEVGK